MRNIFNKKNKENLIYIHGFSADKNDHPLLEKNARNAGFNLYSFDLPGHGENKNGFKMENINLDFLIDYCVKTIKKMNLNSFVLFGHSMGGAICSIIAGKGYFQNELKGLILESPHNISTILRSVSSIKKTISETKKIMNEDGEAPKLSSFIKNMLKEKKDYLPLLKNILTIPSILHIQNFIPKINVPTLLIVASKDIYVPANETIANYSKKVDDIKICTIKDAGHLISVDCPKEFYKYFNIFLKKISQNVS